MVTQLHLALVMAIDARLLVLDEPTLGLDLLYRKQFYDTLLNDYFDGDRTIVVTTHQVEEIQHILTDVMFINGGRIVLDCSMEAFDDRYLEVMVLPEHAAEARALRPIHERQVFGRTIMLFEPGGPREDRAAGGCPHPQHRRRVRGRDGRQDRRRDRRMTDHAAPDAVIDPPADRPAVASRALSTPRPFYWSVRRELWENRSIYIAPLAVAGLILFGFVISAFNVHEMVNGVAILDPTENASLIAAPYSIAAAAGDGDGLRRGDLLLRRRPL